MKKMKGSEFKRSFVYDWPLFVVLPIVASLTISYLLMIVHRPGDNEKLDIFVASSSLNGKGFCNEIQEKYSSKGLKEVTSTQSNPTDPVFAEKLSVVGYKSSDLFILPKSVLDGIDPTASLLPFTATFISAYVAKPSPSYYVSDSVSWGLLIKSAGEENWLDHDIAFLNEDYYLCLNVTSKNIGNMGLYDNPEYNLALLAFTYLQERS